MNSYINEAGEMDRYSAYAAVAVIPWSRVAAVAILTGVVGVTAYVLTH